MHLSIITLLAAAASPVQSISLTSWTPPGPGDVRSPCPGLNTLANHHVLPHSGRNVSAAVVEAGVEAVFNLAPGLARLSAGAALDQSSHPATASFDLDHLARHGALEHDGSLSRADYARGRGDALRFNATVFDAFMAFFAPHTTVSVPVAAAARAARIEAARASDPDFTYGLADWFHSYCETALYLMRLVDPATGATPVDWVRIFFEQERLPVAEGWRTPARRLDVALLAQTIVELALQTPGENVVFLTDLLGGLQTRIA